jgi:hypothetical protein
MGLLVELGAMARMLGGLGVRQVWLPGLVEAAAAGGLGHPLSETVELEEMEGLEPLELMGLL